MTEISIRNRDGGDRHMTGQQIEIVSPSAQTLEFSVPKDITFDD